MCKKINFAKTFFIFVVLLVLVSCASTKFEGTATFSGKIFDQNQNPVENYVVVIDGKQTSTDSAGVFYLENIKSGKNSLSGWKKGYTSLRKKIDFTDRKDFVCIEVERISYFYKKIEALVKQEKYSEAKSMLKAEKKSNGDSTVFKFYDALCDFYNSSSIEEKKRLKDKLDELLEKFKSEVEVNRKYEKS